MLNLISTIETNVEGYIFEVLHREYLNIVTDFEIDSMDILNTNPDYSWLACVSPTPSGIHIPLDLKSDMHSIRQKYSNELETIESRTSKELWNGKYNDDFGLSCLIANNSNSIENQ
jgi:hypothetical protein